jgi:Zn-finger protein
MLGDVKDCSSCTLVHDERDYEYVQKKIGRALSPRTDKARA